MSRANLFITRIHQSLWSGKKYKLKRLWSPCPWLLAYQSTRFSEAHNNNGNNNPKKPPARCAARKHQRISLPTTTHHELSAHQIIDGQKETPATRPADDCIQSGAVASMSYHYCFRAYNYKQAMDLVSIDRAVLCMHLNLDLDG